MEAMREARLSYCNLFRSTGYCEGYGDQYSSAVKGGESKTYIHEEGKSQVSHLSARARKRLTTSTEPAVPLVAGRQRLALIRAVPDVLLESEPGDVLLQFGRELVERHEAVRFLREVRKGQLLVLEDAGGGLDGL